MGVWTRVMIVKAKDTGSIMVRVKVKICPRVCLRGRLGLG